jgi:hypothetical protein
LSRDQQIDDFVISLRDSPRNGNVFNPWWEIDAENDQSEESPRIRRKQLADYLLSLSLFRSEHIIALGKIAARQIARVGLSSIAVRHPASGRRARVLRADGQAFVSLSEFHFTKSTASRCANQKAHVWISAEAGSKFNFEKGISIAEALMKRRQSRQQRGQPGGGKGQREDVHGSGVYPASGPWPEHEAQVRSEAEWGHAKKGRQK